jgi:hypothetical protein
MQTKLFFFALILFSAPLFAQQETSQAPETQTLFKNSRIRGGFGGPIFSWSQANHKTGFGAGGGGGVVMDRFFIGLFGMGETFDRVNIGQDQLALGYGGLWLGYTIPSHKLLHLYTSVKIGGGGVTTTNFQDDWEFDDNFRDATLVVVPEAGLELNIARWFRLGGTVGYRFVDGFEGWSNYGKNDLNAPVYALTFRFGWFR